MFALAILSAASQDAIPVDIQRLLTTVSRFHARDLPAAGTAVQVGARSGLRLVIRERIETGGQQGASSPGARHQPSPPPEYNHSQLIVVAGDKPLTEAEFAGLAWEDLRQDEAVAVRFLGTGQGSAFYAKMPPHEMIWYIQLGGLGGGAKPLDLAFESLETARGVPAVLSAEQYLAAFSKQSVPRLKAWVTAGSDRWERALETLGRSDDKAATEFLVDRYSRTGPDQRPIYWSALTLGPNRKEAKAMYLDMLQAGYSLDFPARAAIEHGWTEFAPLLEDSHRLSGVRLRDYARAFFGARSLRGLSLPDRVLRAIAVLAQPAGATPRQLTEAKSILTGYADPEPIAVAACGVLRSVTKGGTSENSFALEVLLALPRFAANATVDRLVRESKDAPAVEALRAVQAQLK